MDDWFEILSYIAVLLFVVFLAYWMGRRRERMRWRSDPAVAGLAAAIASLLSNEPEQFLASGIPQGYAEIMLATIDKEVP